MKLSFLFELLLILIIIAFAASMPVKQDNENVRKLKRVSNAINIRQNIGLTSSTPVPNADDDDDDDDDDLFDLVDDDEDEDDSGVKKDPKGPGEQESEDSDDEDDDDVFGLADDEAEKDTPSEEEEEEFDGSELILFGEDIFQAVFDDDDEDTNKKKKPEIFNNTVSTLVTPSVAPAVAPPKDQLLSTGHKETELKPSNLNQKITNQTEILTETNSNKNDKLTSSKPAVQLHLQHTPALLELAQSTLPHTASPTSNIAIKQEELQSSATPSQQDSVSEVHPVRYNAPSSEKPDLIYEENDEEKFDETETNIDDDLDENEELIVVPDEKNEIDKPIENIKNPEEEGSLDEQKQPEEENPTEEQTVNQDVKQPLPIADDSENIIPQNDKLTLGPGQIVSEQQSAASQQSSSVQQAESIKKPNKEEDEGLLGIVESIIFDEDDDETDSKPVKTDTTTNQDKDEETLEDDEDEDEDESEDDEDEEDDEKEEIQKPSVATTSTTSSPNQTNTIKKKKKKESSLIGALEESLGLSRILQSEKAKSKGKDKGKK